MNKKNDKFDVWYDSFKIIEIMNKKGSIDELLSEALKILASITSSSDIQIYKESKSTKHITNYASLNKKKNYSEFYENGILLPNINTIHISTDNNSYVLYMVNHKKIDEELYKQYKNVIQRTFNIIFNQIEIREEITKASRIDALTHVGNRYFYNEYIKELASHDNLCITYTIIDLFRLKYVNDNLNHDAGDEYIKVVARLMEQELDENDRLFRIGGDEFVIISVGLKADEIAKKLDRVNYNLFKETAKYPIPVSLRVNFGIVEGINDFRMANIEADKALAKDKSETYKRLNLNRRK